MKVIGHRGWPLRYPDNTLAGITAAAEVADMVETDVRRTLDGVLVLSHDQELSGRLVAATNWDELAASDLGGHSPLSLIELVQAFDDFPFNLEVKNWPGEIGFDPESRLALETAELARPGDLITCFYWPTVDLVRSTFPNLDTGLLIDEIGDIGDGVEHALEQSHRTLVPHWSLALRQPEAVARAVSAGLEVAVWTMNDPGMIASLAALGVGAIITDDPGGLAAALHEGTQQ